MRMRFGINHYLINLFIELIPDWRKNCKGRGVLSTKRDLSLVEATGNQQQSACSTEMKKKTHQYIFRVLRESNLQSPEVK